MFGWGGVSHFVLSVNSLPFFFPFFFFFFFLFFSFSFFFFKPFFSFVPTLLSLNEGGFPLRVVGLQAKMRVSIRISFIFWGLLLLSGFIYAITSLLRFKQIFFEHAGITLTQAQAAEAYAAGQNDERTQHIPKIVHQVFHNWHDPGNGTLPSDWQANVNNCKKLNPNFEFMVGSRFLHLL